MRANDEVQKKTAIEKRKTRIIVPMRQVGFTKSESEKGFAVARGGIDAAVPLGEKQINWKETSTCSCSAAEKKFQVVK